MKFASNRYPSNRLKDTVFAVSNAAEKDRLQHPDEVINATIGSLYDESYNLVAYTSVFDSYNSIPSQKKAAYAASFKGNPDYCNSVYDFVTQHNVRLHHTTLATPGGTGAIACSLQTFLEPNEHVIMPDIAWGSYKLMASMQHLVYDTYSMFDDDHFNLTNFKEVVSFVAKQQKQVVIVINDPCHNPTGYTLSHEEWKEIISFLNSISKTNNVVLLNDIAYIDYSYHLEQSREYMQYFNDISENMMVVICSSCSKTLTSYGLRCGAAIILAQNKQDVEEAEIVFEKLARATWSNIPNAAMINFTNIVNEKLPTFLQEKQYYINLLKQRSDLFLQQAKDVDLPLYPYKEGFFATIPLEDDALKEKFFQELIKHHIYTVSVYKGIRIAICSLPLKDIDGLASSLKHILETCEKGVK